MKKKINEMHYFLRRGKVIVFLFCLNLLFLILVFVTQITNHGRFGVNSLIFLLLCALCSLFSLYILSMNITLAKNAEAYLLNSKYVKDPSRIKLFHKILDENLFEYYFQPIINARTGEIYAYEALMRTSSKFDMQPLEILDLATYENRLYDIESLTFMNTLKILHDNTDFIQSKKLFINSISSHLLKDSDFEFLFRNYGSLFSNVVIEITEGTLLSDSGINSIKKWLQEANCQLALDDYGSGFSNESNLLKTNPNYIKIDRAILKYINLDKKKQHLVSNIVNFASQNNIKTIAEGIETFEEFKAVINLGIDFIQGFFTAKPLPYFLSHLQKECIDAIIDINDQKSFEAMEKRIYETNAEEALSPVALSLDHFTDILIQGKEITLKGSQGLVANINIHVPDNMKCRITLENINLKGNETPAITLGHNCCVELFLVGDNYIVENGIRVPESSDIKILGEGNLSIHAERINGVGIGGAHNTTSSIIRLCSGNVIIDSNGLNAVGIGTMFGNAQVIIEECLLEIKTMGIKNVGIGSLSGHVSIESCGNITMNCEGKHTVAIGSVENGEGCIEIKSGEIKIRFNAHYGSGIGAVGGNVDITLYNGDINIYAEGTDIVGIGDHTGNGTIDIMNGIIYIVINSSHQMDIGNLNKRVMIQGGNILCDFTEDIELINAYQRPLTARVISTTRPFKYTVISNEGDSYEYNACYSELSPYMKVYLPEEIGSIH